MSNQNSNDTIMRFSLPSRLGHGIHALSFVVLFITGCALVFRGFGTMLGSEGLRIFSNIHHFFAIVFTFVPVFILIFLSWKHTKRWLYDIFHWDNNDTNSSLHSPGYFLVLKQRVQTSRFNEERRSILSSRLWAFSL